MNEKHANHPVSYTNRKGVTYFLHRVTTKKGAIRYVMKKTSSGALDALPEDMEIIEGPNGEVSARRRKPRLIEREDELLIETKLADLGLRGYRVAADGIYITVFEPLQSAQELEDMISPLIMPQEAILDQLADMPGPESATLRELRESFKRRAPRDIEAVVDRKLESSRVEPVMRFVLSKTATRKFSVERMTFRGSGGWWSLSGPMPLERAADEYLRHLGKDSFFELM